MQGDICDSEVVSQLAGEVECIVNFAAETHVDRSILDPSGFIRTDVLGTHELLEAARNAGHARFLQVSTDEVYGDVEAPTRSVETDPIRPRSPYSASKASGDLLCFAYHATYGLPVLVTRGSNTYGPYQYPEKIVPLFITQALDHQPLPIYGDGSAVRDYLHVDDHARGIATVLARGVVGEAYNLGRGQEPMSGMKVAETVLGLTGGSAASIQPVLDRPGHDRRYALDSQKAQGLGWRPEVDFEEGIARTVKWYEEHRDWWGPIKSGEFLDFYRRNYHPWSQPPRPPPEGAIRLRILLLGAGGQLGRELTRSLVGAGHDVTALDRSTLDITDVKAVRAALEPPGYQRVVNCAAYTKVDQAEIRARTGLRHQPRRGQNLALACAEVEIALCHVSTDFVFTQEPRDPPRPWAEDDVPEPRGVYAESKRAGELDAWLSVVLSIWSEPHGCTAWLAPTSPWRSAGPRSQGTA